MRVFLGAISGLSWRCVKRVGVRYKKVVCGAFGVLLAGKVTRTGVRILRVADYYCLFVSGCYCYVVLPFRLKQTNQRCLGADKAHPRRISGLSWILYHDEREGLSCRLAGQAWSDMN